MGRKPEAGKGAAMMPDRKDIAILILLLLAGILCIALAAALLAQTPPCALCNARVSFVMSPGAEEEVISLIRSAHESVDVEMYVFTSDDIVRELGDAAERGVKVRVILEPRVEDSRKQKVFDTLRSLGVDARWASMTYKLTHSKLVIVDGKRALVGSINFSESALNYNREMAAEIESVKVKELSDAFETDWQKAAGTE